MSFRIQQFLFLAAVLSGAIASCSKPQEGGALKAQTETSISLSEVAAPVFREELRTAFSYGTTTEVVRVLNEVKFTDLDFELISDVACAYSRCTDAQDDWDWQVISNPHVRINLVDVLVQANRRGMPTEDIDVLVSDVTSGLGSNDPNVVHQSLLTLSYLDRPEDISNLVSVAENTLNTTTFRVAIIALRNMAAEGSAKAVEKLIANASDTEREAIADLQEQ